MAMNSNNHPEDQASIEAMHNDISGRINDQLMYFQDDAYALGRSRGLKEGDELRAELLAALEYMVANIGQPRSLETREGFAAAEAVIAKAHSIPLVELSDLIEEHARKGGDV